MAQCIVSLTFQRPCVHLRFRNKHFRFWNKQLRFKNPLILSTHCSSRYKHTRVPSLAGGVCVSVLLVSFCACAFQLPPSNEETYNNVPRDIQGSEKELRIQKPISPKAERCTQKCVSTCIRGGGEGPLNLRRPLVVFKEGFRSRKYCLVECSDICNLIGDGDDGP